MNKNIDQAQIYRLQWEKENLINSIKCYRNFKDQLCDKKLRKEVSQKIEIINVRLNELDRICSILRINI